jgi:hypothetical protein
MEISGCDTRLEDVFITELFIYWATLQQGWVDLWLLLSKCRENNDMQAYNKKKLNIMVYLQIKHLDLDKIYA